MRRSSCKLMALGAVALSVIGASVARPAGYTVQQGNCTMQAVQICHPGGTNCTVLAGIDLNGTNVCYAYGCSGGTAGMYNFCISGGASGGCSESLNPGTASVVTCTTGSCNQWQCTVADAICTMTLVGSVPATSCRCPAGGGTPVTEVFYPSHCDPAPAS